LSPQTRLFQSDGTYLITGGFGGFGLEVAAWMVGEGVRNLALTGRHGAMSDQAQQAVDQLRRRGARVLSVAADVSKESDVTKLIAEIGRSMPPLRGVFHLAAVLDDGPVNRVDPKQIENVMGPKANGAWNLHRHTLDAQLDYFVLFSSIASMVGGPGQAPYAMACAYLDVLAHYRRGRNLPATAIHWGALSRVGMAARHSGVEQYLSGTGVKSFAPAQAVKLLGRILHWNPVELGVADMDWRLWGGVYPAWAASPKYGALAVVEAEKGAQSAHLQPLLDLEPDARPAAITVILTELLATTLQTTPEKIDCDLSLLNMGVDSLMAMDLQSAIEKRLAVKVSTLELMKGNTLMQLAQHVALKISSPGAAEPDRMSSNSSVKQPDQPGLSTEFDLEQAEKIIPRLNDLTDEEVDGLIEKMMAQEEIEA
jgi:NADP-dependent 3-hydroxy acid dehydrogenase YdfG/acyl carrier protein